MKHNQEDIIGIPLYQPMPPEIWAYINKDPQEFMSDEELQAWHEVCKHQVSHHPDGKMRKTFQTTSSGKYSETICYRGCCRFSHHAGSVMVTALFTLNKSPHSG